MNAQVFAQAGVIFVAGVTGVNVLISFIHLLYEERKKCSIIKGMETEKVKPFFSRSGGKKYAVMRTADRYA